ncbi:MAG TPA: nucleoside phosphorylase [Candidatus Thermoplasmatota archaeon]|nr:nucleoside phosphorylase [Candidatus Thermoplasmatota archaeon]
MDDEREILTPLLGLRRRAEHGGAQVAPGSVPTRALFTWGEPLFEAARILSHAKPVDLKAGAAKLFRGTWGGESFVLVNPGIGAPATALVADKLHACGVDTIVGVGFAGILHPLLASGDIIVIEKAIGEDGVSRSYLGSTDEVSAAPIVKDALELSLGQEAGLAYQCGTVWTTDTPYRETVGKAKRYRARGAQAVEMETAALYSVAKWRGFRAGAAVVLSDSLCRIAPLDAAGDEGLEWAWTPAPTGSLDGKVNALLRAALPVVVGPLQGAPLAPHTH